jgi:CubicO group peptidase (beta-lactamase class C family)
MALPLSYLFTIAVGIFAALIYAITQGGTYHPPQCTLLGIECPKPVVVEGYVAPKYAKMKQVYQNLFDAGNDVASCVAVFEKGEKVVDLCGGYVDGLGGEKPFRNALQNVFSSSKAVTGIIIAILVDRGHIEYEKPIATYWPDFAQGGKENVTVTDLLQHAGGVTWMEPQIPFELIQDESRLDELAAFLAKQKHNFNSVRTTAYHMVSGGLYLNELIRRVDPKHRTANQFLQEEIAKPLNVEFTFGLPLEKEDRFSPFYEYPRIKFLVNLLPRIMFELPFLPPLQDRETFKGIMNKSALVWKSAKLLANEPPQFTDSRLWRNITSITSAGGFTNAVHMAKIGQIMALEGELIDGIKFFKSSSTPKFANTQAGTDFDLTLLKNITRTYGGFGKMVPGSDVTGWAGLGGSLNVWNPEKKFSFAYVPKAKGFGLGVDSRASVLYRAFAELNK